MLSTRQRLDNFNRDVDILYRVAYLHETLEGVAQLHGLHGRQAVRRILDRIGKDERVLHAVSLRAQAEERKLEIEYEIRSRG